MLMEWPTEARRRKVPDTGGALFLDDLAAFFSSIIILEMSPLLYLVSCIFESIANTKGGEGLAATAYGTCSHTDKGRQKNACLPRMGQGSNR